MMVLVAVVLPVYALGYDWRSTDNCAPDLPLAAFAETRRIALATWGVTLIGVGGGIWICLQVLARSGGMIWWAFGLWKAISLGYALVVTPGCFEGYSSLAERGHPLEAPLGLLSLFGWLALIMVIGVRATTARREHASTRTPR